MNRTMTQPPTIPYASPHSAPTGGVAAGLTPAQIQELADARQRVKPIRRAIALAKMDAWSIAIFAGLTLLGTMFSWLAAVLGIGMGVIAYVEFQGLARLRRLDPEAPRMLAWNQVALGSLLLLYAAYSIFSLYHAPAGALDNALASSPQVANMMVDVQGLMQTIYWLMYGTLAAVAIFGQGSTALFYLSRRRHIENYVQHTPQWIIQAQQAGLPM